MLTIDFDPEYPQSTLDTCSFLVELVCDYASTPRDTDIPGGAQAGIHEIGWAVVKAHDKVNAALNAGRKPAGVRHPVSAAPRATPPAKATEVMDRAADFMGEVLAMVRHASAEAEGTGTAPLGAHHGGAGGGEEAAPPRYTVDDLVRAARRMAAEGAMTKAELREMLDAAGIEDDAGDAPPSAAAPRLTRRRANKPPASAAGAA